MIDVIWDMETGDPDDYFTLLFLIGHPRVNLKAITITPGSPDQVGLVKKVLNIMDLNIPIGSFNINCEKNCVSGWYYNVLGNFNPYKEVESGADIIYKNCDEKTTIITGGPLKNLGATIKKYPDIIINRLVAQGGFAGEGVVPKEFQLEKFKRMVVCPTYNLNGDRKSAINILKFNGIKKKCFVSKNVCHGVIYDKYLHNKFRLAKNGNKSLEMIYEGMEYYLKRHPDGKKFHDPLAACSAIDENIIDWKEVEIFYTGGKWGSKLSFGTNTWISINYNKELFEKTLLEKGE